jgi:pre-60S factor REI1
MPVMTCNACNQEFNEDSEQKLHYKSDWHRYNLKRKIAGVPGVTEGLFIARQTALAQEKSKANETPMLYSCTLCGKGYRSTKAHTNHLQSRSHILRAASEGANNQDGETPTIKPLTRKVVENKPPPPKAMDNFESDEDEDEWEEVDSDEELVAEASKLDVDNSASNDDMVEDKGDDEMKIELDPACCFVCDLKHGNIESCMVHMHKHHGFFIPDVEYLKDPVGLLTYLGLKVKRDLLCLYCNDRVLPFASLEAVRKHMIAKSHCKVHYGDGDDDEEVELEEFYDYSSSYVDNSDEKQLVAVGDNGRTIEIGNGSELVISTRAGNGVASKSLGSREYLCYYRQKPRPAPAHNLAIATALASRYKSMGLVMVQPKERTREEIIMMKVMKQANKSSQKMNMRLGMKSNVIRNLPNNVPY